MSYSSVQKIYVYVTLYCVECEWNGNGSLTSWQMEGKYYCEGLIEHNSVTFLPSEYVVVNQNENV